MFHYSKPCPHVAEITYNGMFTACLCELRARQMTVFVTKEILLVKTQAFQI